MSPKSLEVHFKSAKFNADKYSSLATSSDEQDRLHLLSDAASLV